MQTAYLKAHYTPYFFKALLNLKRDDSPSLNKYIVDARDFGVTVKPPHVNKSDKYFSVKDNQIVFGLLAIKGIGETLVDNIITERERNGRFKGLEDLLKRVPITTVQFVRLVKAGAIPTKDKRGTLLKYAETTMDIPEYKAYKPTKSLPTLIELQVTWGIDTDIYKAKDERLELYNKRREKMHNTTKYQEWQLAQQGKKAKVIKEFEEKYLQDEYLWEFETLSMFLSNNPFENAYEEITGYHNTNNGEKCVCVCVIVDIKRKKDKNGNAFAYLDLYTPDGIIEGVCWASKYSKYQAYIKKGSSIAILGRKNEERLFVEEIKGYQEWIDDKGFDF